MNFNQKFYPDDLGDSKRGLENLHIIQEMLYIFLADFLVSASGVEQITHFPSFLNLLATIRLNLESVNRLLPLLHEDYRFKASTNLIYRSIVGDLITLNYLIGFIDLADPNQVSLGNELDIFNKEYLLSIIEGLTAENEYNINDYTLRNVCIIDESQAIEACKINTNLLDINGEWKNNADLRTNTNSSIIQKLKTAGVKNKVKGFISENEKIKFLKEIKLKIIFN